ncbi:hypothetical protein LSH36_133g05075 [Paralvinella palmiformis]|uniref:Alpha/beta hydrolase fold-3 domain-containing protein n=1 Tax=Paralvinella palmiformis TaxID=53620 RepID=A0AAD9JYB3_9ANNE|nr:hypothetical protein LSH36_133g05075 [Paralvinella palmiformis]
MSIIITIKLVGAFLAVLAVAIPILGLRERVPKGFSNGCRLRIFMVLVKMMLAVGWLLERVHMLSIIYVTNLILRIISRMEPEKRKGRAKDTQFGGVVVRVYTPNLSAENKDGLYPGMVFYHGGGWAIGNTWIYDDFVLPIVNAVDIVVVSVEYRLAPKFKYPIPLDDCLAATKYFMKNASKFNVDPNRIAICGDSAGGNLAAAVCLKLRDEKFKPMPKLQVLIYPVLQSVDFALPSMIQNADGPLLTTYWLTYYTSLYATGSLKYAQAMCENRHVEEATRKQLFDTYVNHDMLDMTYRSPPYRKPDMKGGDVEVWKNLKNVLLDPYFSPLLCNNLTGLPQTFIYAAKYDVLRDEAILYAKRLKLYGVDVSYVVDEHALHGMCSFRHFFPKDSYNALNRISKFLKENL